MPEGAHTTAFFTVGDRDGVLKADGCTLAWTHDSHAANDAQPARPRRRSCRGRHPCRARTEAVRRNRLADFDGARHALRGVARRIDGYAGSDAGLRELSASPLAEQATFSAPVPELDRKRAHYRFAHLQRSRGDTGEARR